MTGAAWSVPVIALAAPVPVYAASGPVCQPTLTILPGSFKCCSGGPNKTLRLVVSLDVESTCGGIPPSEVCITDVNLDNGQAIQEKVGIPVCGDVGQVFTIDLLQAQSCPANLIVDILVDGQFAQRIVDVNNIPGGDPDQCG